MYESNDLMKEKSNLLESYESALDAKAEAADDGLIVDVAALISNKEWQE